MVSLIIAKRIGKGKGQNQTKQKERNEDEEANKLEEVRGDTKTKNVHISKGVKGETRRKRGTTTTCVHQWIVSIGVKKHIDKKKSGERE